MARGEPKGQVLAEQDRARVAQAVADAERRTGLQLCVYLGPAQGDPRQHAEGLLAAAGASTRPAVMLYVAPDARRVECVVAPFAVGRVTDADAQAAVDAMLPLLAAGDTAAGLEEGLARLAAAAGPARGDEPEGELPDLLG